MTDRPINLAALARALGGEVAGRDYLLAPGPGHSRQDRSLSVTVKPDAPEGFVVNSFAGDDPLQCRDHVRALAGLPAWAPSDGQRTVRQVVFTPALPDAEAERKAAWVQARVVELWGEALDPRGAIVQTYLESRCLTLPDEVAGISIRFHPACPWKDAAGKLIEVPAMVSAMRCVRTDRLKAIHRTRLTSEGLKVDRRMLGDATEAAIKLDPDEMVTAGLTAGEGIETTLAARQLGFKPAWAMGSVGGLGTLPVLSGIDALTLLSETDKSGANARAIDACGTRWHDAGRIVLTVASRSGGDINDALKANRRAA